MIEKKPFKCVFCKNASSMLHRASSTLHNHKRSQPGKIRLHIKQNFISSCTDLTVQIDDNGHKNHIMTKMMIIMKIKLQTSWYRFCIVINLSSAY